MPFKFTVNVKKRVGFCHEAVICVINNHCFVFYWEVHNHEAFNNDFIVSGIDAQSGRNHPDHPRLKYSGRGFGT